MTIFRKDEKGRKCYSEEVKRYVDGYYKQGLMPQDIEQKAKEDGVDLTRSQIYNILRKMYPPLTSVPEGYVTISSLVKRAGVTYQALYARAKQRGLEIKKVSRSIYVRKDQIDELMRTQKRSREPKYETMEIAYSLWEKGVPASQIEQSLGISRYYLYKMLPRRKELEEIEKERIKNEARRRYEQAINGN